ncbi:MAG: hypothetical protein JXR97_03220 [Planctomycetes bacterium]|nr:hypothetical protein [Planctomycetota bacterium]
MTDKWPEFNDGDPKEAEGLRLLSQELEREFSVEQALLPSGVEHRVLHSLPNENTIVLRFARALSAVILLASVGCIAFAAGLARHEGFDPISTLRLVTGTGAVVVAVLLSFAAPQLVQMDARILRSLTGRFKAPGALDLLLVRLGALLILICGGVVLSPLG